MNIAEAIELLRPINTPSARALAAYFGNAPYWDAQLTKSEHKSLMEVVSE